MKLLFSLICLMSFTITLSQDGTLDSSFGDGNGYVITNFGGLEDQAYSILEQEDSKIVAFGFSDYGNYQSLARYLPDGTLDNSFGTDGKVINDFNNEVNFLWYGSVLQQADQKLVTAATHRLSGGNQDFMLARYLTNGDLDASFGTNGTVMTDYGVDILSSASLLLDGNVLAGGWSTVGSSSYILMAKYLPNGDLDPSFGVGGIVDTFISDQPVDIRVFPLVVQPDGKIVVASRKSGVLTVHRYLANGTLDPSFGTNGVQVTNIVYSNIHGSIAIKNSGHIVAVMRLGEDRILAQFMPDGSLDTSFGTNGIAEVGIPVLWPIDILLDQDENILVSGNHYGFEIGNYYIARYGTNGSIDLSFGTNGVTELGFESHASALQSDDRILVSGGTYWYNGPVDFIVLRFRNGILETSDLPLQKLTVFPNPSKGLFTVQSEDFLNNEAYQITDLTGKLVQQGILSGNQTTLYLSSVESGLYFLNAGNSTIRLIKE